MKIYNIASKQISFQSKFVRNPIVQTTSEIAKNTKSISCKNINTGLSNISNKIFYVIKSLFIKTEIEKADRILKNHPLREKILGILQEGEKESQKAKLEFLKIIKNLKLSDDDSNYLMRLLQGNFTKEPLIAKVWGLCVKNGLDIYTLMDSSYTIDKKCAENISNRKLLDKYKAEPKQALLMSRFDSDETIEKVSKYAGKFNESARARLIARLPMHNDILTNSALDLIHRFEKIIYDNNTEKTYLSGHELDLTSYWKGSTITLEDIASKNNILDIIEKKENISDWYYISDIINRTEPQTELTIAGVLNKKDISLKTANKIATMINEKNKEFINTLCCDKSLKIEPDNIPYFVEKFNSFSHTLSNAENLPLAEKISILKDLESVPNEMKQIYAKFDYDIDYYISVLNKLLGEKVPVVRVPSNLQREFLSEFLANNNLIAENIIKTHDFTQYGKEGIPLKYSRKEFCKNINDILSPLTNEEQNILLKHFGLIRGQNYADRTVSLDGILNNIKFDDNNVSVEVKNAASKILEEIEKFTVKNESLFEDKELKTLFDSIIKGFPEFTAVIGKEQHNTHAYSVDIHTLKVLQSSINNPLYSTLSDKDKTVLKMSVLMHDLGKPSGVRDANHPNTSAYYAEGILEKIKISDDIKKRIIDIVQNHHWFEKYNKGFMPAEDVAVLCRRAEDYKIYQIMAKADLENVNNSFHLGDKSGGAETQAEFDKYMEEKFKPVEKSLNQVYSRHNPVFYTRFVGDGKLFPTQKVKIDNEEVELRVLDLNKLSDNDSLEPYGFPKGTTKENVRFLVHMTKPNISSLESVIHLAKNSLEHNTWSTSIIKPSNNVTYENLAYGFALNSEQANFADAYFENIASGNNKTFESFRDILLGKILRYDKSKLGIDLTQDEHKQLCDIVLEKGYIPKIKEDIIIGGKTITPKQICEAFGGNSNAYLRDIMIENLEKEGFALSDNEYADLTKYLLTKKYLTQITKPNLKGELTGKPIQIGRHSIPATTLVNCLNKSLENLFDGGHIQSEVIALDVVPAAFIAKAEKLEQCHHDFLAEAKKYKDTIPAIIMKDSDKI